MTNPLYLNFFHQWDRISFSKSPLESSYLDVNNYPDKPKFSWHNSGRCFKQFVAFTADDIILEVVGLAKCLIAAIKTARWALKALITSPSSDFPKDDYKNIVWNRASEARNEAVDQFFTLIARPFAMLADDLRLLAGIAYPAAAIGPRDYDRDHDSDEPEGFFKNPYHLPPK